MLTRKRRTTCLIVPMLLGTFVIGCEYDFNIDCPYANGVLWYLTVSKKGATSSTDIENGVDRWYQDRAPTSIAPVPGKPGVFRLCFSLVGVNPPHVGAVLNNGSDWKTLSIEVEDDNNVTTEVPGTPSLTVSSDPGKGRVLRVHNPSESVAMRITTLEVALSATDIDLDDLNYGGGQVVTLFSNSGELAVPQSGSYPVILPPGQTTVFDVSDAAIGASDRCYARLLVTDSSGSLPVAGTVHNVGPDHPVPTVSQWTAIAMTLLLLSAGTIVFFRKRGQQVAVA